MANRNVLLNIILDITIFVAQISISFYHITAPFKTFETYVSCLFISIPFKLKDVCVNLSKESYLSPLILEKLYKVLWRNLQ